MRAAPKYTQDRKILQELVPLNALSDESFRELAGKIIIEEVKAGRYLFRKGDRDHQSIYLLDGKVSLIDGFRKVAAEVEAGTDISRYPVGSQQPRAHSAKVARKAVIARIDSDLLDAFLTWDQSGTAEVVDIGVADNNDWMTRLLQSEAFCQLPPAKLQGLLMKMKPVEVQRGEVIVEQGSVGDYFYTIHEGRCAVTRQDEATGQEVRLAELSDGDSFGEESLVSSTPRNATITMLTDGQLMRLAKQDFVDLLKTSLVRHVSIREAEELVQDGAVWLDVRTPDEYQQGAFEDSVNIPLATLRSELSELMFNAKYVICCDTGRRSESAGFLLGHSGFDVYVLEGGMASVVPEPGVDAPAGTHEDEEAVHALLDQLSQLESEYGELQAHFEALQAELQHRDAERNRLEDMLGQLRDELGESAEKMTGLYGQVSGLDEQKRELQEQFSALQAEQQDQLQTIQLDLERERYRSQSLQRNLEAVSGECSLLAEQLQAGRQETQASGEALQARLNESRLQVEQLTASLDEVSADRERLTEDARRLENELAGLRSSGGQLDGELAARDGQIEELRAGNAALERQLDGLREELANRESRLGQLATESSGQLNALQRRCDGQLAELDQLRDRLAGEFDGNEQASAAITGLQGENSQLRATVDELNVRIETQAGEIERLAADRRTAEEAYSGQQAAWADERDALQSRLEAMGSETERLQAGLASERAALDQARSEFEQQLQGRSEAGAAELERQVQRTMEVQTELDATRQELELARAGQERLQQQVDETAAAKAESEGMNVSLQAEITSLGEESGRRIAELQEQVAAGGQQLQQLQAKLDSKEEQLTALRLEVGQHEVDRTVHAQELELVQGQLQEMQQMRDATGERVRELEQDLQETTRKSHEDLRRKNDNEKELQGQVERLRKKLEQVTSDFQKSRKDAQDDIDRLRDELHAEREARDDERAQMAARQRELKEQLSSIASEHEAHANHRSGVIEEAVDAARNEERARLQGVIDAQAATELMLEQVQAELRQAHAELTELHRQEKDRRQVDIELIEEQNRQAEAAISQLHTQLRQLTDERDNALEEQLALRGKMDALRGEVEVARGLMNTSAQGRIEDPVQLRKQLDETRKNVEIAVRLRAEAEAARDRLLEERDRLLAQTGGVPRVVADKNPRDEGVRSAPLSRIVPEPVVSVRPPGPVPAGPSPLPGDSESWFSLPRLLGIATGVVILAVAGVAGWQFLGNPGSGPDPVVAAVSLPDTGSSGVTQPEVVSPPPVVEPQVQPEPRQPPEQPSAADATPAPAEIQTPAEPVPAVAGPAAAVEQPEPDAKAPVASGVRANPDPVVRTFSDRMTDGGTGPEMVQLAPAKFLMGSPGNSINAEEVPRHEVSLASFSISRYEVTFDDYDRYARATGQRLPFDESWGRDRQPVINVSWKDARGYVRWLSAQTGKSYRLPSEAEWEYAARSGNVGSYWWTNAYETIPANCFNCGSAWDGARTAPVGQFAANSLGLYDMAGNVQEWTADCYHPNYTGAPADGRVWEEFGCTQRVVRGGAYTSPLDSLRSAKRAQLAEDTRLDNLGFRIVRTD